MKSGKAQMIFERRKATIKKKAGELSSRCNADVCVLCFGPDGGFDQWPEDPTKALSVIDKYREATMKPGRNCKRQQNLNLSDVLEGKKKKKKKKKGVGLFSLWEEELALLPKESLLALSRCLDSKIHAINARIHSLTVITAEPAMGLGFSHQENCFSAQQMFLQIPSSQTAIGRQTKYCANFNFASNA